MPYSTLSKYLILSILFILSYNRGVGQKTKVHCIIEISPHFSKVSGTPGVSRFKLSHLTTFKIELDLQENISPVFGLGYLNTGDKLNFIVSPSSSTPQSYFNNYNYFIIPAGIKIKAGSLLIQPEVALALNIKNTSKVTYVNSNGVTTTDEQELSINQFNKRSIPFLLTIGKEVKFNHFSMLLGLKGYYGLNRLTSNSRFYNNYYGFGMTLGCKF